MQGYITDAGYITVSLALLLLMLSKCSKDLQLLPMLLLACFATASQPMSPY
jgi:hypothetical protein